MKPDSVNPKTKNDRSKSTKRPHRGRQKKPEKPYPEFPLYAHNAGVWAKSICGRDHYFGPWSDPHGALERYLAQRDFLHAGIEPPAEGVTLDELVNRFIAFQQQKAEHGEIGDHQLRDYMRYGRLLLDALGRHREADKLRPFNFEKLRAEIMTGRNANTAAGIIIRLRTIFKWGKAAQLLADEPEYGGAFNLPPARARRRASREGGPKDLTAAEIIALIAAVEKRPGLANLHAMILLGINCGFGNTDCAELRTDHLDLDAGVVDFPRPKTEAERRAMLWPETVDALRATLDRRRKMKGVAGELADLVFVTRKKAPYVRFNAKGTPINTVSLEFGRLLKECKAHRKGLGFYALRRTYRTIADETRDWPAIDLTMGHLPDNSGSAPFAAAMGSRYRQRIGDDRLQAIADHVRAWLWPADQTGDEADDQETEASAE